MTRIEIDVVVHLTQDVPELELHCGDVGIVRSTWFEPSPAYEVEFARYLPACHVRALLLSSQIQAHAQSPRLGKSP